MKIIVDNLNGPPPHALSRQDLRAIVNAVPSHWHLPLTIHLRATLPEHTDSDRPVTNVWPRMNVRKGRRLAKDHLAEIDRTIEPILARVEQALAGRIELPERDEKRWYRALKALDAAGYSSRDGFAILRALEAERQQPTSGRLPDWVTHGREALREAGIDPETLGPLEEDS